MCFILKVFFFFLFCLCYICVPSLVAVFLICGTITRAPLSHPGSVFDLHLPHYGSAELTCASHRRISFSHRSVLTAVLCPQRVSERETRPTFADETPGFYFPTLDIFCSLVFFFFFFGGLGSHHVKEINKCRKILLLCFLFFFLPSILNRPYV